MPGIDDELKIDIKMHNLLFFNSIDSTYSSLSCFSEMFQFIYLHVLKQK